MSMKVSHLSLMKSALLLLVFLVCTTEAQQLRPTFYDGSCPKLSYTVRAVLERAVKKEPRIAASLLRLHFHDVVTMQGCDGSILLDDRNGFTGEKTSNANRNSARGFEVVDDVKTAVENVCPGVVSCADILAIIAQQSVQLLVSKFQAKGLAVRDLVALSGAHTIGQARCTSFRDRLYNFSNTGKPDPNLSKGYLSTLQRRCPRSGNDNALSPLDFHTPTSFDNSYFDNLENNMGLLNSDQVLFSTSGASKSVVSGYEDKGEQFFGDFAAAMVKMSNLSPLTGNKGQIRKNCRVVNS